LILEDRFRWAGSIQITEIIDVMANRDASMLGPVSLEMMITQGKAGELAEMMLAKEQIFPAFYAVLTHPKWPPSEMAGSSGCDGRDGRTHRKQPGSGNPDAEAPVETF
jgi:hypothetical protein